MFNKLKVTVMKDAKTGNKKYHNSDVFIEASIGKKLPLFFILICNQKIDNGYNTFAKVINTENKYPFFE